MLQLQYTAQVPLIICEKTIVEEIECEVFVDFDCNEEPYVSEIWLENLTANGVLKLKDEPSRNESIDAILMWGFLEEAAWKAVEDRVAADLREAA